MKDMRGPLAGAPHVRSVQQHSPGAAPSAAARKCTDGTNSRATAAAVEALHASRAVSCSACCTTVAACVHSCWCWCCCWCCWAVFAVLVGWFRSHGLAGAAACWGTAACGCAAQRVSRVSRGGQCSARSAAGVAVSKATSSAASLLLSFLAAMPFVLVCADKKEGAGAAAALRDLLLMWQLQGPAPKVAHSCQNTCLINRFLSPGRRILPSPSLHSFHVCFSSCDRCQSPEAPNHCIYF